MSDDLLYCIENLCGLAAMIGNAAAYLYPGKVIPLATQANHVCLCDGGSADSQPLVKQRSDTWHSLRKESIVTGSTINTALGLDGLKKQKEFIEEKSGKRPEKEIPTELQQKFQHGTENELNAVATLVSLFLPAFSPGLAFYEEGCYLCKANFRTVLVVSPDGSIRDAADESKIVYGVEIKCPYPGKIFTTPVHYEIPRYYVPQVLSEMYSLGAEKLMFVSYSMNSMTVHSVEFDGILWGDIFEEVKVIDNNYVPKKFSERIPEFKSRISEFCKSNVRLIAIFIGIGKQA